MTLFSYLPDLRCGWFLCTYSCITQPIIGRQIVHWITSSVHENSKLRTCFVHKLFFVFVLTFWTICVHMFWALNFRVLNSYFNEQYFVILWVSWWKNSTSEKDLPVTLFSYLPDLRCGCFLCTRMERSSVDPAGKYDSGIQTVTSRMAQPYLEARFFFQKCQESYFSNNDHT